MRIWLIVDGDPLPTDGIDVRLLRSGLIAKELVQKGDEVIWWASTLNHAQKQFRAQEDKDLKVASNYRIKLLHSSGYQKNISIKRILHNRTIAKKFLFAANFEEKPDIILAAMPTIELALAATQYARKNNIPILLDLRDKWPDIFVEVVPKFLQPLARLLLFWQFKAVKMACKKATGLIGITQAFLDWGLKYAGRKQSQFDAVYTLAYSADKPNADSLAKAKDFWLEKGLKPDSQEFIIVFAGVVTISYRLLEVIAAVKRLGAEFKLVIAGLGPMLDLIQKEASGCTNIIFPGWLDKSKLWALLELASVGIAPYINREDFLMSIPNKITEYLSAGLPIITSLSGTTEELLTKYQCGLHYDSDNVAGLVILLNNLRTNSELLQLMSKNAKLLYEKMFIAEEVYAKLAKHLEKITMVKMIAK